MTSRFDGQVVVVTGSGKGIGRAEALLFASEGAKVVVNDVGRDDDGGLRAEKVVAEIAERGGESVASVNTVSTFEGCEALVQTAVKRFGRLDVVVNNAGLRAMRRIDLLSEGDYESVLGSHLKASFAMTKYSIPFFVTQGSGVIVNTGSEAGLGMPFNAAYAAAKEGMAGLTRTIAREFGGQGIRCNLIRPRAATSRTDDYQESREIWGPARAKLGRYALGARGDVAPESRAEDVAVLAAWLSSDAAADINGYDFYVAGDEVGLWSEPELVRYVRNTGGWTLDDLDKVAPGTLTHGLSNRFTAITG